MDKMSFLSNLETFEKLCEFIETHDADAILEIVSEFFDLSQEKLAMRAMGGYSRVINDDGSFTRDSGAYIYVLLDVKQNLNEYKNVYSMLSDEISREIFLNQMRYRIVPAVDYIENAYELSSRYKQYFDEDIIQFEEEEVFVDCGGYIGDTTEEFIERCSDFKRVYIYEPLIENFTICEKKFDNNEKVKIRQSGVGKKSSSIAFHGSGSSGSFASGTNERESEDTAIDLVSLDEDIQERVSFIKIDVECFEPDTIRGAAEHIINDSPKLAICLYHMVSDIWEIPKLINSINPYYRYYIRQYDAELNIEYVLYAVPSDEATIIGDDVSDGIIEFLDETGHLIEHLEELPPETVAELYDMYGVAARTATENIKFIDPELRVVICDRLDQIVNQIADYDLLPPEHESDQVHVYTPAIQGYRKWNNVELLKDKGLTGYLLAKEIGAKAVMFFGSTPESYPYLEQLPGLEMLYSESTNGDPNAYYDYLFENYQQMDVLILHGMYDHTMKYLDAYRKLRPDGKVYCGLDMNSGWMNHITWHSQEVKRFASQCDIIATSCRYIRDILNHNNLVHFPCRWIPNGFYDVSNSSIICESSAKENIIITVGRIGSKQKNNEELMLAFAKVFNKLPNWRLRLIGPIEEEFKPQIDKYFKTFPNLKEKVVFTGAVNEKGALYQEYARAKVFALTSVEEGGTPNVYAEALYHGCMLLTSDIDAADDITNYGELGIKYPLGDIDSLSRALIKLCNTVNKRSLEKHILKAQNYATAHFDWNRNAKKLGYMLYN